MSASRPVRTKLKSVHPTQMTVGYREVAAKRRMWRALSRRARRDFLRRNRFPAVVGPEGRIHIVDHHHLGLALLKERVRHVHVETLDDLSHLAEDEFWIVMELRALAHPYDRSGRRRPFSQMPKKLARLEDDPYRALAAAVRDAGDYPKDAAPFSEFLWADFFRRRIRARLLKRDPRRALKRACRLAQTREARHLPDWRPKPRRLAI